jgi:hypothetical protein
LIIDLVKPGNQPRQAVGFLPDGDMVVVNDAAHQIGREDVVVEVLSTRVTGQGLLVFARLAPTSHHAGADGPPVPRDLSAGAPSVSGPRGPVSGPPPRMGTQP